MWWRANSTTAIIWKANGKVPPGSNTNNANQGTKILLWKICRTPHFFVHLECTVHPVHAHRPPAGAHEANQSFKTFKVLSFPANIRLWSRCELFAVELDRCSRVIFVFSCRRQFPLNLAWVALRGRIVLSRLSFGSEYFLETLHLPPWQNLNKKRLVLWQKRDFFEQNTGTEAKSETQNEGIKKNILTENR